MAAARGGGSALGKAIRLRSGHPDAVPWARAGLVYAAGFSASGGTWQVCLREHVARCVAVVVEAAGGFTGEAGVVVSPAGPVTTERAVVVQVGGGLTTEAIAVVQGAKSVTP